MMDVIGVLLIIASFLSFCGILVSGIIALIDSDDGAAVAIFCIPSFVISTSLVLIMAAKEAVPLSDTELVVSAFFCFLAMVVLSLLRICDVVENGVVVVLGLVLSALTIVAFHPIFSYSKEDRLNYIEWKLSEMKKNGFSEEELVQLHILEKEVAFTDREKEYITQNVPAAVLEASRVTDTGVSNIWESMQKEYENTEVYRKKDEKEDKKDEKKTDDVSSGSSKLVFLYKEQVFVMQVPHQKGKCFDVRNKGISLNACYEGKGNIEVKLVDEAGFSVSGVYSANDFLNGPVNLNNVVQNRGE